MNGFPSFEDRDELRALIRQERYSAMNRDQKMRYHAYDYAFQRLFKHNNAAHSPIDEAGRWYDLPMVDQATEFFKRYGMKTR